MPTLNERAKFAVHYLRNALVLNAPIEFGILMTEGIGQVYEVGTNSWEIIIGGGTVDYAVYTNEVWVAPRWKGKKNPNQGWIEKTIIACLPYMRMMMTGGVTIADIEDVYSRQDEKIEKKIINQQYKLLSKKGG